MTNAFGVASARADDQGVARFAADVQAGLSGDPRWLPPRYFYDPLGSALFDAICRLPWYRITRAESRLLAAHRGELWRLLRPLSSIVELGPGNGEKLTLLLDGRDRSPSPIELHLVDVSSRALEEAARALEPLQAVRVIAHQAEYEEGLREIAPPLRAGGRTLVLFLGSNIGNFDPPDAAGLLDSIRASLRVRDGLLLGTDLVKRERALRLAYDDPLGVTAAFNRNLLVRINRELGGDFALDAFAHDVVWNAAQSRVEMYLTARTSQRVRIARIPLELTIRAGERIWTESSYKYRHADVERMLAAAAFRTVAQWTDEADGFLLTLAEAA